MLAGLIVAIAEAEGEGVLRAELPLAGQTLIEQQARLLASAGATHLVLLVERLPPALLAAVDRLRRDGLSVEIARNVAEAADRVHPEERLVLLADGVVTDRAVLDRLLARPDSAVLTLPDTPAHSEWERIDADARWGGLMLLDGALLRTTAAMLGDWDLQSTLLRRVLQAGALYVDAPAGVLAMAGARGDLPVIERALGRRRTDAGTGLLDRMLFAPAARLAAPLAMRGMLAPAWFVWGAVALLGAAGGLALIGRPGIGLGLAMLSGPVAALGRRIAALGWRDDGDGLRWRDWAGVAALLALAWQLYAGGAGWGVFALAGAILGLGLALIGHRRFVGKPTGVPGWLADLDTAIWGLLPFAVFGAWVAGLVAVAGHMLATLLMIQKLTARKGSECP
ncbi:hypothetical protein [Sphingomonas flavalba]|uniref:hypothetical protein n=1 Tax=Sphingomonas flavalba TaxID=2559804 RepID=UPI00109DBDC6|nr:hypothetical protein [Sphingomonas flavalba]